MLTFRIEVHRLLPFMYGIAFLAILCATVRADTIPVHQTSTGHQSHNIYNCDNVNLKYSRDPKDVDAIVSVVKANLKLSETVQSQQQTIADLQEKLQNLSCRLQTRAERENDTIARAAEALKKRESKPDRKSIPFLSRRMKNCWKNIRMK